MDSRELDVENGLVKGREGLGVLVKLRLFVLGIFLLLGLGIGVVAWWRLSSGGNSGLIVESNSEAKSELANVDGGGRIYYWGDQGLSAYEFELDDSKLVLEQDKGDAWTILDGYAFLLQAGKLTRFDLATSERVSIEVRGLDVTPEVHPSPDGSKVVVTSDQGFYAAPLPDQVVVDFDKHESTVITDEWIIGGVQWFSDNVHVMIDSSNGNFLLDSETGKLVRLEDVVGEVGVSSKSLSFINVREFEEERTTNPLGDVTYALMYQRVGDYMSGVESDGVAAQITPFSKFPVVARDYKGVSKILAGKEKNYFFMEIDAGKKDIYFTTAFPWGTFKKITPNNGADYKLLAYSQASNLVLALKGDVLVVLSADNYSETNAGIYEAGFAETELVKLRRSTADVFYLEQISFSPNGRFVAVHEKILDQDGEGIKVFSVEGLGAYRVGVDFGDKLLWVD